MQRMWLQIEKEHIDNGRLMWEKGADICFCYPIALALSDKGYPRVQVNYQYAYVSHTESGPYFRYRLSEGAISFIKKWKLGLTVEPQVLILTLDLDEE